MPKTPAIDRFDEILAKSQRLNSQIGVDSVGASHSLRRGVSELSSANNLGFGNGDRVFNETAERSALKLLAKNRVEVETISDQILKPSQYDPTETLDVTDLDSYLAHHHDMIVLTALEETRRAADESASALQRKWLRNDWSRSRREFIESLGYTSQQWSGGLESKPAPLALRSSPAKATPEQAPTTSAFSLQGHPSFHSPSAAAGSRSDVDQRHVLSPLMREHAGVIEELQKSTRQADGVDHTGETKWPICSKLAKTIRPPTIGSSEVDKNGLSRFDLVGYKATMSMLAAMVGEDRSCLSAAGFYAPICFPTHELSSRGAVQTHRQLLTTSARAYFEDQHWKKLGKAVEDACQKRQMELLPSSHGKSKQQAIKSYVGYLWRTGHLYGSPNRCNISCLPETAVEIPLWPYVYYLLSVGNISAAYDEIVAAINYGLQQVSPAIATVLQIFVRLAAQEAAVLDNALADDDNRQHQLTAPLTPSEVRELKGAMSQCREMYEAELAAMEANSPKADEYRMTILNLVSLTDPSALADTGIPEPTIEIYLWTRLWFISFQRTIATSVNDTSIPASGESEFYDDILSFGGASYFDPQGSSAFVYARVLFACHRFGDAILYLWKQSKTLPAVHLAAACLHYGLILPHMALAQNPPHRHAAVPREAPLGEELTPAAMLQFFFNDLFVDTFPEVAVDYFLLLDTNWRLLTIGRVDSKIVEAHAIRSQTTVSRLFENFLMALGVQSLSSLVGAPNHPSGKLRQYLSGEKINLLLARCGYHLLTVRRESNNAIHFFKMCGRYVDILEELCSEYAGVLASPRHSQHDYWEKICLEFHNDYIRSGSRELMECLEKERRMDLLQQFKGLLNLGLFVKLHSEGQFEQALAVLDEAALLPRNVAEVNPSLHAMGAWRRYPNVLRVLDDIVLLCVDCARNLSFQIQEPLRGSARYFVDSEKKLEAARLAERCKAVDTFGAALGDLLRPETIGKLRQVTVGLLL